jgi:predicted dehydrogenase (TIGR03970 family)
LHSDVLIVGAGSAGSVVAERLSADERCRVTVVEAGPGLSDPDVAAMTADGSVLPIGPASTLVRRFETVLTDHPRRTCEIVRGALVGGSGAVNGGYFCRGLPADFDGWGVPGWAWADVLAHFRQIETDLDFGGPLHGSAGPIPVRRSDEVTDCTSDFIQRCRSAGFADLPDLNGAADPADDMVGIGLLPLNITDGIRVGPGSAFLQPALARPNLTLLARTSVARLRISSGRVVGVDAMGPDGPVSLTADRIVLCSGAIGTAQVLMLSGIGDETVLRTAGVPCAFVAPVGMNCVDHPEWVMPTSWVTAAGRPVLEAVLRTDFDVEIRPYTGGFIAMVGDGNTGRPDWPHVGVAMMQPRSRGRVTVVSDDPGVIPRIEHRYDGDRRDTADLQRGCALARELCAVTSTAPEPLWSTSQHLCATAPIGAEDDERAVLDPQCRVRGVDGLWVIDGSALPAITRRGPHATIVMLAHRAAEFVAEG